MTKISLRVAAILITEFASQDLCSLPVTLLNSRHRLVGLEANGAVIQRIHCAEDREETDRLVVFLLWGIPKTIGFNTKMV